MALAMYEMKLVLATVLSRYELALCDKGPIRPHRRGITFVPSANFQLMVTQRRSAVLSAAHAIGPSPSTHRKNRPPEEEVGYADPTSLLLWQNTRIEPPNPLNKVGPTDEACLRRLPEKTEYHDIINS